MGRSVAVGLLACRALAGRGCRALAGRGPRVDRGGLWLRLLRLPQGLDRIPVDAPALKLNRGRKRGGTAKKILRGVGRVLSPVASLAGNVAAPGLGGMMGGATENWFAYVLALVFLVFRPQGLFGERIIERV